MPSQGQSDVLGPPWLGSISRKAGRGGRITLAVSCQLGGRMPWSPSPNLAKCGSGLQGVPHTNYATGGDGLFFPGWVSTAEVKLLLYPLPVCTRERILGSGGKAHWGPSHYLAWLGCVNIPVGHIDPARWCGHLGIFTAFHKSAGCGARGSWEGTPPPAPSKGWSCGDIGLPLCGTER